MLEPSVTYDGVIDQRYYHFVLMRDVGKFTLSTFWRQVGETRAAGGVNDRNGFFEIQHRRLKSNRPFARGSVLDSVSQSHDGKPPYLYDLFAVEMRIKGDTYFAFVFPFIGLALDRVGTLLNKHDLAKYGEFQRADVGRLLGRLEEGIGSPFEGLSSHLVGLHLTVTDDKHLSAIRLGGSDPLKADVYREFLRGRLRKGYLNPAECVLACERDFGVQDGAGRQSRPRLVRSRVHMDSAGNFKYYAHVACANLAVLPYAIGQLRSLGCLIKAAGNPLARASQEEFE